MSKITDTLKAKIKHLEKDILDLKVENRTLNRRNQELEEENYELKTNNSLMPDTFTFMNELENGGIRLSGNMLAGI